MLLAVGAGGAIGSVARYEIGLAFPAGAGGFPWATWLVNVSGALVLGLLVTLVVERWAPTRYVRPFAGAGVCGGYTTWSTFMAETVLLTRDRHAVLAAVYVVATLVAGFGATVVGVRLARTWSVEPVGPVGAVEPVEEA